MREIVTILLLATAEALLISTPRVSLPPCVRHRAKLDVRMVAQAPPADATSAREVMWEPTPEVAEKLSLIHI